MIANEHAVAHAPPECADDPRWLLVERILATQDFQRSPRLSEFLRHICLLTLTGQESAISEQYLGQALFGRKPEYDSSADTIVRSHALRLRRRLEQYFRRTGRSEELRLVIPRGGYVPVFVAAVKESVEDTTEIEVETVATEAQASQPVPDSFALSSDLEVASTPPSAAASRTFASSPGTQRSHRIALAALLVCSLALLLLVVYQWRLLHILRSHQYTDRNHPLWSRLFNAEEPTQIVLGDSGLVLFHAVTHRYVTLKQYVNNDLSAQMPYVQHVDPDFAQFLAGRRYTSFVDATTAIRFLRLPEATPDRTLVNFSRDMHLDDFKNGNVIMIGAQEANPWVELFERSMDFNFSIDSPDHHSMFINRHPLAGEQAVYNPAPAGQRSLYALIAFLPNLSGHGNVLLLEGITMAGTEAAVDLTMDDQRLLPLLQKIRRPNGTLPHFEMLIASDIVKDSPASLDVIALHVRD